MDSLDKACFVLANGERRVASLILFYFNSSILILLMAK